MTGDSKIHGRPIGLALFCNLSTISTALDGKQEQRVVS